MSKSLEFCKKTAIERSEMGDRDWNKAIEENSEEFFDVVLKQIRRYSIISEDDSMTYNVNISFNPDGDFQYFTSETAVTDGTLFFIVKLINRCVNKVIGAQTYYAPIGPFKDKDEVSYTVGNFIIISEIDDKFAPEDKPWCTNRITVMLPLKYSINDKE